MKVLMLNGSSHINGTTMAALNEVGKALEEDGVEYEIFQIGGGPIADCLGCGQCTENGCIFSDDAVNAFVEKAKTADGYIFGTPVYYAHPSGRIQSFLDRVFYSSGKHFAHKPGASVAVARREQIFRYYADDHGWFYLLEPGTWKMRRGCGEGSRGDADDAESWT